MRETGNKSMQEPICPYPQISEEIEDCRVIPRSIGAGWTSLLTVTE